MWRMCDEFGSVDDAGNVSVSVKREGAAGMKEVVVGTGYQTPRGGVIGVRKSQNPMRGSWDGWVNDLERYGKLSGRAR